MLELSLDRLSSPESGNDDDYGPHPNKEFLDAMDDLHRETQAIYDEL